MSRDAKEKRLRQNIEVAVEREMRQIEKLEHRTRKPGEVEQKRKKWEESANRIHKNKLHEVWNE